MTDITPQVTEAALRCQGWTFERVRAALSVLAEVYSGATVDWEEPDEDWGRVISDGEPAAYISARCPIAFVRADGEAAAQSVLTTLGVVVISARDFDAPSFRVDRHVLSRLSRRPLTENVSYERTSVNEIWWATV